MEWVQEVTAHLAVVSWRARRVVHSRHVVGRVLEGATGRDRDRWREERDHLVILSESNGSITGSTKSQSVGILFRLNRDWGQV